MLESKFQANLIKEIKKSIPGCLVFKHDGNYIQGFPDIVVYHGNKYAVLECKRSENEPHRPNQDYYIQKFDEIAFGSFISPETKDTVLAEMKNYLEGKDDI